MTLLQILFFAIALLIMLVGLAGVILPVIPGIPLIFAGYLLYYILTGFKDINIAVLAVFIVFLILDIAIDYLARYFGVKKMGGSTAGSIGAIAGAFAGLFIHWIAIVVFPFLFAVIFELIAGKKKRQALKAGAGVFLGLFFSLVIKFAMSCVLIGLFVWTVLF